MNETKQERQQQITENVQFKHTINPSSNSHQRHYARKDASTGATSIILHYM